jgi:hypothetical protein
VPLFYVRGGGMMMRGAVSNKDDGNALLFVDSSAFYPLALDDAMLKRSGADLANFRNEPGAPAAWKLGMLPYFKLGTLDLPMVPAMQGAPLAEYKSNFDVDLAGVVGAGLLSAFRVTFGDDGRWLWLEVDPSLMGGPQGTEPRQGPEPLPPPGGAAGAGAPSGPPVGPAPPPSGPPKPGTKPAPKSDPPPAMGPAPAGAPGAKSNVPKTESKGAAK